MKPPPGMEDMVKPGNVLRLKKAIYGLKQSPRAWYHKLSTTLNGRGFVKSEADHTLFTLTSKQEIMVIMINVSSSQEATMKVSSLLKLFLNLALILKIWVS